MTEKEILQSILYRLDEISAKVKRMDEEMTFLRKEMNERFDKVDHRLEYLGLKWMEHDEKILELTHKRSN